jgi:hypothetical protein
VNLGFWLLWESYPIRLHGIETESRAKKAIVDLAGKDEAYRFFRAWRENFITREDILRIKALGLDHVRVPFNSRILMDEPHFDMAPGEGWALMDRVLAWCEEAGLHAVLDMHSAPGGQNAGGISDNDLQAGLWEGPDTEGARRKTVELWREIAARYRGRAVVAAYDLLNEPVLENRVDKFELTRLYARLIKAVREVDPDHMLMIEGNWYATDFSMFEGPAPDGNMVWHFHKYWNETGRRSIQYLLDLKQRTGMPLYLGETGENSPRWYAWCLRLMEENGIGWCFWPWKRMGKGCPQEMEAPEAWRRTAQALTGKATLGRAEAAAGLAALAEAMKLSRCREDSATLAAFSGRYEEVAGLPGVLRAEDYARGLGRSPGNALGIYRPGDLDIGESAKDDFHLSLAAGESAEWDTSLARIWNLEPVLRVRSATGAKVRLSAGPGLVGESAVPAGGGGWAEQAWPAWNHPAGRGSVRLEVLEGNLDLDSIAFRAYPGKVEAEDFKSAGDNDPENQGKEYRPSEAADIQKCSEGGYNIGWISDRETLSYEIEVREPGRYDLLLRVASLNGGGSFRIITGAQEVLGTASVPSTGGWDSWTDLTVRGLTLPAGKQSLTMEVQTGGFNLNYLLFVPSKP